MRSGADWRPPSGKRGANLHAAMVERRSSCIRRLAGKRALEMQITRFLRNRAVTAGEISAHAAAGTAARVAGREVVAIQDTSELALGGRRRRASGYGPVGKGGGVRGLLLHAVLALDAASGAVLGLVEANVWNRTGGKVSSRRARQTAEKELQRWIEARDGFPMSWRRHAISPACRIKRAISTSNCVCAAQCGCNPASLPEPENGAAG